MSISGYLRLGKLSESEQQLLERCAEQVAHEPVRQCIQELCAWVEETGRKPLLMSADVIERSQASRWNHAQRSPAMPKCNIFLSILHD